MSTHWLQSCTVKLMRTPRFPDDDQGLPRCPTPPAAIAHTVLLEHRVLRARPQITARARRTHLPTWDAVGIISDDCP